MVSTKKALIVLGILSSVSMGANAGLKIYANEVEQSSDASNQLNYEFFQKGLSLEETSVVGGFGKKMPLSLSLKMIVPQTWLVNLNKNAEFWPVDWVGQATWPYVLEGLAKSNDLNVTIDWEKRVVDVFSKDAENDFIAKMQDKARKDEAELVKLRAAADLEVIKAKENARLVIAEAEKAKKKANEIRKAAEKKVVEIALAVKTEKAATAKIKAKALASSKYAALEDIVIAKYIKLHPGSTPTIRSIFEESNVLPVDGREDTFVRMMANETLREFDTAVYHLKSGSKLSDSIAEWARAANWDSKWKATSDFKLDRDVYFTSKLFDAVDEAIFLYKDSTAPVMSEYFIKNKVIETKDFNYEK